MTKHMTGTRKEWLPARLELLKEGRKGDKGRKGDRLLFLRLGLDHCRV